MSLFLNINRLEIKMSRRLNKEEFTENVNTQFRLHLTEDQVLDMQLTEVLDGVCTPRQEQFSLFFRGPLETPLQQGTRTLEHEKIGTFELFLVPIARTPEGMSYEAVFNRFTKQDEAG